MDRAIEEALSLLRRREAEQEKTGFSRSWWWWWWASAAAAAAAAAASKLYLSCGLWDDGWYRVVVVTCLIIQ